MSEKMMLKTEMFFIIFHSTEFLINQMEGRKSSRLEIQIYFDNFLFCQYVFSLICGCVAWEWEVCEFEIKWFVTFGCS